jgi:phage shock protein E
MFGLSGRSAGRILRRMDWVTLLVILAAIAAFVLFKQLGLVSPDRARTLLQQGAKVVDVRSVSEFQAGHWPGVLNIPLGELKDRIGQAVPDRSQPILLHCHSGGRSGVARRVLHGLGYTNAHNLGSYQRAGGILSEKGR